MSKAAKPEAAPATDAAAPPAKKSKKKLIIIIIAVVVLGGAGVVGFLLMNPAHPPQLEGGIEEHAPETAATYAELGTFTANLIQEEGDRYLQTAISLKLTKPELVEKIKASNPEILHRVNMLLQSKRPSELSTFEGKQMLADQIKAQVEYVLGLRKAAPTISTEPAASDAVATDTPAVKTDIAEVLFTSFIIQ